MLPMSYIRGKGCFAYVCIGFECCPLSVAISAQFAVNHVASRSGVVAMSLHAPRGGQDATFLSMSRLATASPASGGMTMLGPSMVTTGIVEDSPALSQARKPLWAPDVRCPNIETGLLVVDD